MYLSESNCNGTMVTNFIIRCKNVENIINDVWKKIILCNFKEAMENVEVLFAELQTTINYASSLSKTKEFSINIGDVFEKLTLLESAMTTPDYILVADLIKYEIEPVIEEWQFKAKSQFKVYLN